VRRCLISGSRAVCPEKFRRVDNMTARSGSVRRFLFLLVPASFLLAGCPATPPPSPVGSQPPATQAPPSTAAVVAPSLLVNGVVQPGVDVCAAMKSARDNDVITIRGSRGRPIDLATQPGSSPKGLCQVQAGASSVTVRAEGDPLLLGRLAFANNRGWVFDGINITLSPSGDAGTLVAMVGGDGWRWTNCEIYGSRSMTDMSIGHWTGEIPVNFRLDHCYIHDNPGDPNLTDVQNDNIYVFTSDGTPANGLIEDNVFARAPRGSNVKIGGTGLRAFEGSDGITFRRNTLVNDRGDGANLLVATDSDDVSVTNNIFVVQGKDNPVNVHLGSFSGSNLVLQDNLFFGFDPNQYPEPRPILYAYYGTYDSIDLNQTSPYLTQARNIRHDPRYPALAANNPSPAVFPSVTVGGVSYGASL
jgi:hypothetical protein